MTRINQLYFAQSLNVTTLTISLSDIEQILQIAVLVLSGIVSIIVSIKNLKNGKD